MKQRIWKRLVGLLLSVAILAGTVPTALAAESKNGGFSWKQVDNSVVTASLKRQSAARMGAEEPPYGDGETVRISIELEDVPTMERFHLERNGEYAVNSAAKAYRSRLETRQKAAANAISKQVLKGKKLDVVWNLTLAANIISANVEYGEIGAIEKIAGVKAVFVERQYAPDAVSIGADRPNMQFSSDMTGTQSGAWDKGYKGQGMRIAIIDTGIDTDHQSFNADAFGYALEEDAADDGKAMTDYDLLDEAEIAGVLSQLNAAKNAETGSMKAADVYYNAKIPYGYCYVDKSMDITHDNDEAGEHGSHVAGIATANRYLKTGSSGDDSDFIPAMDAVHMTGQAPDAQVLVMKVFGRAGGAYESDWMAAIEDAILLGSDTINLSLGSDAPGFAAESGYAYRTVLDGLVSKNAVVTASAGNSSGWADAASTGGRLYSDDVNFHTGGFPGSHANSFCVASVDNSGVVKRDSNRESQASPQYAMSYFSSWGVPGDLSIKPEITAPGGNIWSVNGAVPDTDQYEPMSGTSMAAPQVAGIGALVKQFIENNRYSQAGMTDRALAQSLMMSTAAPLKDENGQYYPILQQGAGLVNAAAATSADSYITVEGQEDGKAKLELGDDPNKTGKYQVKFEIHNLDGEVREYDLSGELFTQNTEVDKETGFTMLTKDTKPLDAAFSWSVEGGVSIPDKSVRGCDFNGDGAVDEKDAQLLLDHVVKRTGLAANADKADVDKDGNVDTRDVHVLLTKLSAASVAVPAKDSVTVTAAITLDADAAAAQMADCPNGFYVEGYLRAEGKSVKDDRAGTAHSIPLLGFYGNWSDPSMFEKGSTLEYAAEGGSALPAPYIDDTDWLNYLWIEHVDGSGGMLGSNPCKVKETVYLPERAAINSENGDTVLEWRYSSIRNAAASRATVKNAENPAQVYKDTGNKGPVESAYFYYDEDVALWRNTMSFLLLDWAGSDARGIPLPDGTVVELGITLAPEYYVDGKNVDWDSLGKGASLTQRVAIDNTAPELLDVENQDKTIGADRTVTLEARDNRYVAAIALLDPTGTKVLSAQCPNQMEKGVTAAVTLDLSKVVGKMFFVQVVDYAGNTATYEVEYEGLESVITDPDYVFFDKEENNWYGLRKDAAQKLGVLSNGGSPFYAAELVNGCMFALDGPIDSDTVFSSTLYAMPLGTAADLKKVAVLPYTDFDGETRMGYPMDMAYSKQDQKFYILIRVDGERRMLSYLYSLDPKTGAVKLEGCPLDAKKNPVRLATLAIDDNNRFYSLSDSADSFVATSLFQFSLSDLSTPEEKKAMPGGIRLDKDLACLQSYASTDWDSENGKLVYALTPCSTSSFRYKGTPQKPTVIYEIDPSNPGGVPTVVYSGGEKEMYHLTGLTVKDTDGSLDMGPAHQAAGLVLSETELGMAKGGSFQLEALVAPWTLENREVAWSSDNPAVAAVSDTGKVTAVGPGTATITATSKAPPFLQAECAVSVTVIEANLKALAWDAETTGWWADVNTASLPRYERIREVNADYGSTAVTEDGKMYVATYGQGVSGHMVSDLYSVDPDTLEGTMIAPITLGGKAVYVNDLAPIPLLSQAMGTDYLLGICAGVAGYIINGSTGEVEGDFSLNDTANVLPVGAAFIDTYTFADSGAQLSLDLYAFVGADGGVYEGYIAPDGNEIRKTLVLVQQSPNFETGVSTHGCTEYNSLVFAAAEDGKPYLFWSVFDGEDSYGNSSELYAIDFPAGGTYHLGSFPAGVWPVSGLTAVKVPPGPSIFENLDTAFNSDLLKLQSVEGLDPELPEKPAPFGSLNSVKVGGGEGSQSAEAVTVDRTAKTVTVPITAAQSANGRFALSYDPATLTFQSLSYGGPILHSDTETAGKVTVGYAALDEINGKLAEAVFTYEPGDEEQTTAISLQIMEDGAVCNSAPVDGNSAEITLPAKPAKPGLGTEPAPDTPRFVDVPEGSWYHDDVYRVAEMGLVVGVGANRFSPGEKLTRGMLAAILYRLAEKPETTADGLFSDVADGRYYTKAIAWAAENDIAAGYGNNRFGPEDPITREQLATILWRYSGSPESSGSLDRFTDGNKASNYAVPALQWAVEQKIVSGKGNGILDPKGNATRAEVAAMLMRYCEKTE